MKKQQRQHQSTGESGLYPPLYAFAYKNGIQERIHLYATNKY